MYLADYHVHSRISPDASASMQEMAEAAIRLGFQEICFTDHVEPIRFGTTEPRGAYDWDPMIAEFRAARTAVGDRITLRLGAELGDAVWGIRRMESMLAEAPPLDFLIGSIHTLSEKMEGRDLYFLTPRDEQEARDCLADYLGQVRKLAEWGRFQVLGHLTLPLRYLNENRGMHVSFDGFEEEIAEIFRLIIPKGIGIELNTNRGNTPLPDEKWLRLYRSLGGEIVTLQVKENSTAADKLVKNVAAGVVALKSVTENADGLVTSVKLYDGYNDGDGYVTGVGTEKAEKSTVMLKSIDQINDSNARYAWTDDVVVVRYDYKGDFNISRISSIKDDDNDGYIAVLDGDVITGICVLEKDDKGPQKPQEEKGLALNSLSFSDKGMKINFTNNSGAEFQTGAKADVVVKNSKGTQVCSIKGVQVTDGSVADKASATITFSEYTAVPSTTGEYTVTLTITAGHGTFTVTDVLGTI